MVVSRGDHLGWYEGPTLLEVPRIRGDFAIGRELAPFGRPGRIACSGFGAQRRPSRLPWTHRVGNAECSGDIVVAAPEGHARPA